MKPIHALGGLVVLVILAVWGITAATVNYIFTGEAFPND
jgi:hypothetical protein